MKLKRFTMLLPVALAFSVPPLFAEEAATETAPAVRQVVPVYPSSVESMIERRREAMERRKDDYWDAVTGRRWRQAPWTVANRDWADRREDLMNERFRQYRDALEFRHDQYGRWANPWSQSRRDWNQARRDARDLNRLYRDEYYDSRYYGGRGFGYRPFW